MRTIAPNTARRFTWCATLVTYCSPNTLTRRPKAGSKATLTLTSLPFSKAKSMPMVPGRNTSATGPMRQDTVAALEKVFQFIGVEVGREQLQKAVDSNSLERMKAKEDKSRQLRQDRFVRSGSVRGWEGKLTAA